MKVDTKYCVLSVSENELVMNEWQMINFVLQYHVFKMYTAYNFLIAKDIRANSIETDAIAIHQDDIDEVFGYNIMGKCEDSLTQKMPAARTQSHDWLTCE